MPALATIDEFLDLVRKSGVAEEAQLSLWLHEQHAAAALPDDPEALAGRLIRDGLLSQFQARQLLAGKWQGFRIGKYRILELLGVGGMGRVFLCEHVLMKKLVAVKVLPSAQTKSEGAVRRFYREARAAGALDHPHIVRAHDVDCVGQMHYLVLEFVDGTNLHEIVRKHGPLDVSRAVHYVRQAALGLQHAHQCGWVHRDIKPGNLLVDRGGTVKLLDMGLARLFADDQDAITANFDDKSVLGTADYLAPEQAMNSHDVDIRADIYSLGGTLYFLLTGRAPFEGGTVAEKLLWHQVRQPEPIQKLRPEVPAELAGIIERMMAKDRAQRWPTPAAVVEALDPWTRNAVPPPADCEMPRWTPAVARLLQADSGIRRPGMAPETGPGFAPPEDLQKTTALNTADPAAAALSCAAPRPRPLRTAPAPFSTRSRRIIIMASSLAATGIGFLVWLTAFPPGPAPRPVTTAAVLPPNLAAFLDDKPLPPAEAFKKIGEKCTVEFEVKGTGAAKDGTTIFLNSETDFRSPTNFTVVIFKTTAEKIQKAVDSKDLRTFYKGKVIQVTGMVETFQKRPQIEVRDPDNLKVVDRKE